jgi:exopolysaccharide biosynthesis polyprenyl glycosylphosphotransferase
MLKQYCNIFRRGLMMTDTGLLLVAFFGAYFLEQYILNSSHLNPLFPLQYYLWAAPLVAVSWTITLYLLGMYESFRLKKMFQILFTIIQSAFFSFIIFSMVVYVFRIQNVSRSFMMVFFALGLGILTAEKLVLFFACKHLRSKGFNFRNILIVGTGFRAQNFIKELNTNRDVGLKVVGIVDEDPGRTGEMVEGYQILGGLEKIPELLRDRVIDYVIFIVPRNSLAKIEPSLIQCELVGVTSCVSVDLFNLRYTTVKETNFMGVPMITFQMTPYSMAAIVSKRLCDLVLSGIGLVLISPIYFGVALAIKLSSKGTVHFRQERVGLNGRTFNLYKFRTMHQDAEAQLKSLLAHNEMSGPAFKMENDPRIRPVGKFLRKYSLDELPQLWNVFCGDMSLVGPRPPLVTEVKQYDDWHKRRLSMRPGITCLWQVSGRNKITSFDEWARLDLKYIDEWSLSLDFKILMRTVPAVLSASGAK